MGAVKQYCDRAIMIEKGVVAEEGTPERVAAAYQQLFADELDEQHTSDNIRGERWGSGEVRVKRVTASTNKNSITITTDYTVKSTVEDPVFGISIYTPGDIGLIDANTHQLKQKTGKIKAGDAVTLSWELPNLFTNGKYRISAGCTSTSFHKVYDQVADAGSFIINRDAPTGGVIFPETILRSYSIKPGKNN
jgi:hypothetical protein